MSCRVCGNTLSAPFATASLFNQSVSYFDCTFCGYVQTQIPTWLDEAYASVMNTSDTGIMARNLSNLSLVLATLTISANRKEAVVDYAGGYGFLVRLLRDIGVNALWADPYCENLVARGFEYQEGEVRPALVTAFEAFEHFVSPAEEMQKLLGIAPNVLLTTTLIPRPAPHPKDWWYYGLDHGQHIGFFRVQTLKYLAKRFGVHLLTDGVCRHFFSRKKHSYIAWSALTRVARLEPRLFSLGLQSRTWADHVNIVRKVNQ